MELSAASLEGMALLAERSGDPVDELVERVRPLLRGAVDTLQVAAALEADGLSDRAARVGYGYRDVFELAGEVYRRRDWIPLARPPGAPARPAPPRPGRHGAAWRDLAHGGLYLLPSAVFPAVLAVVDARASVWCVVLAGGFGWLWAGSASWLGYQLAGAGEPAVAGRALCWAAGLGVALAAGLGTAVAAVTGTGPAPVLLAAGVLAYQMAATLLMFHRREQWLPVVMGPGVLAGIGYLAFGPALLGWALATGAAGTVAALAFAVRVALRAGPGTRGAVGALLRARAGTAALVSLYGALSAALLLHAQLPYLAHRLDVVLTVVPLVVSMGFVEWRARRFGEQARALLVRVRRPARFVTRVWLLLGANVVACWSVPAVLGVALLVALRRSGTPGRGVTAMLLAYTVLAGAYLVAFVLAEHGRYGRMCLALATAIGAHVGLATGWPHCAPVRDTALFAGSAVLLFLLLLAAVAPSLGQVWRYR